MKGANWLNNQLTKSVPIYDSEFKLLKVEERKLAKQDKMASRGNQAYIQARHARMTQRNTLITALSAKRVAERQAYANLVAADRALDAAKKPNASTAQLAQASNHHDTMTTRWLQNRFP